MSAPCARELDIDAEHGRIVESYEGKQQTTAQYRQILLSTTSRSLQRYSTSQPEDIWCRCSANHGSDVFHGQRLVTPGPCNPQYGVFSQLRRAVGDITGWTGSIGRCSGWSTHSATLALTSVGGGGNDDRRHSQPASGAIYLEEPVVKAR